MAEHDASPDIALQLKKRARRRLIGAAALALFAVIFLPLVMDHEPRPPVQDIQVRIPAKDGAPPLPMPSRAALAEARPDQNPELKPESRPETGAPLATPRSDSKVTAPTVKPPPAPEAAARKPAPPPPAIETEKTVFGDRSADTGSGQWVVQLGAYKEQGNVKLLLSKLKGMGVPAYTENYDSPQGPRIRVRAGPFPSREAAEKARVTRIKVVGVDGPVAPR